MNLTSSSFDDGQPIPRAYTVDGKNVAPPLAWSDVPRAAKSLALIVEDPDAPDPAAPQLTFGHWVVFDLDPAETGLPAGAAERHGLPSPARQGRNDYGRIGYGGPSPPIGRHRYVFRLYALDTTLRDRLGRPDRAQLLAAIEGHVLAEARLTGTYARGERSPGH